jgi:hypothetical protein
MMLIYRVAALRVGPVGSGPVSQRLIGLAAASATFYSVNWYIP